MTCVRVNGLRALSRPFEIKNRVLRKFVVWRATPRPRLKGFSVACLLYYFSFAVELSGVFRFAVICFSVPFRLYVRPIVSSGNKNKNGPGGR